MERLQPLSKLVIRNDKTISQEAFYNFTQLFLEYLESLKSSPPYQCNRSNKSIVLKYTSFLFQVITRNPQMAIFISPHLLQICTLLMNPLNDNQIREDTWRQLINCINCYDVLVIFKSFLSNSFDTASKDFRIDIGEVGKISEEVFLKQFDQVLLKLKKSQDFEKFKLNMQIMSESFPIKTMKNFSLQNRNKMIIQVISEVALLEKKFKSTLFSTEVDPKLIVYVSEIFNVVSPDQSNSHIIYRLIKWTFPYVILNEKNEDLTKRANMLYFINHSKYRGSLALSYFRVLQDKSIIETYKYFYEAVKSSFHDIFVKIIDRAIQVLPFMIQNLKNTTDNYAYMYSMCKLFTHALRLKGITQSLLQFENEKSIIGYFLSISVYNLPFDMLPFMTIFLLTFLIDRKSINLNEESHFVDNLLSIVSPNYITQIIQVVSKFASQMTVGFSPSIFKIKNDDLRNRILNNPVIFEKENINNHTFNDMIKKNSFIINTVSTTTESSIVTTTTNIINVNTTNSSNRMTRSSSSDGFFKILRSIHFFFNIDCKSFNSTESFDFIFNYIQSFDRLTNDTLISIITDTFSGLIRLFANFNLSDFDFSLLIEKFLPFVFKILLDQKHNSSRKELLFSSFERFITVLNENFLLTIQTSRFWCVSILSMLPKKNLVVLHAAIQACLNGLPYSFSLVHAIVISISDWKFRDDQIVAFLSCISMISPEFRNYSLQELQLFASSSKKADNNLICMSFLLLLHNLFGGGNKEEEVEIDKGVRFLFLDSLGKMKSSPSLVTSLLLLLPSFFDLLESKFELVFDTILMDVNELMIKLMETKNLALVQTSSYSSFANIDSPPPPAAALVTSAQPTAAMIATPTMIASPAIMASTATTAAASIAGCPPNCSSIPLLPFLHPQQQSDQSCSQASAQPNSFNSSSSNSGGLQISRNNSSGVFPFIQASSLNTESQAESDPVLNSNLKLQSDELSSFKASNDSIRRIVDTRDYSTIQIFKSVTFFCVKLFLSSGEKSQIRKRIVELFQSWTNYNNRRTDNVFHEKFRAILFKSVGLCFAQPKSNFKTLKSIAQNDTILVSKQSSASFVVSDKGELNYDLKASLDYCSSAYSIRPIRNSHSHSSKARQGQSPSDAQTIGEKSRATAAEKPASLDAKNRGRLNHFSFRSRYRNQENLVQKKQSDGLVKSPGACLPGLSLVFDALEEANGSEIEIGNEAALQNEFMNQFESNFKKKFFIRLIYAKCRTKVSNDAKSTNSTGESTTKSTNSTGESTTKSTNNTGESTTKSTNNTGESTTKSTSSTGESTTKSTSSTGESTAKCSSNQSTAKSTNNTDENTNDKNSSVNDPNLSSVCESASLFDRFVHSLGIRDSSGSIVASTLLYDAIYEMEATDQQIVAVVWVEESVFAESVIKQLSHGHRYLVLIILSPSKSGIINTKVLYSNLLLSASSSLDDGGASSNDSNKEVYYFDSYRNYVYPSCETNENLTFCEFGPLIGSLFLPYTLIGKLVTETAVNAVLFRKTQMKNMNQSKASKKKKRKLFHHKI